MGRVVGVELRELVSELSKVRLKPPTPSMCGILARRGHFERRFVGLSDAAVLACNFLACGSRISEIGPQRANNL